MRRHHTGSGRRSSIPTDWAAHHARAAEGTHTAAAVTLRRADGKPTWDPTAVGGTGATVPTPGAAYATNVAATITALADRGRTSVPAEEQVDDPRYLVSVASVLPCTEGDVVLVTAAIDDPLLTGRTLHVDQVLLGTDRFERDLLCTLTDLPPTT